MKILKIALKIIKSYYYGVLWVKLMSLRKPKNRLRLRLQQN